MTTDNLSSMGELGSRTPYGWLRERDIDLLVCAELHARGTLARLLAQRLGHPTAELSRAWVSHSEIDGESDLVAAYAAEGGLAIALIENKIAAAFQSEQAERYALRARRWSETAGIGHVATVLLAPSGYMSKAEAQAFDSRITYEEAAACLRSEHDARSIFLADALEAGVDALLRGYVAVPDAAVTDMWRACWEISLRVAPNLHLQEPGVKPGQSTWFYFYQAEGFEGGPWRRAVVVYKAERGQADLQFGGLSATALAATTKDILEPSMKVVAAGKSASIRIDVPIVDFKGSAESQEENVIAGLIACDRLRSFFTKHRELLLVGGR